MTAHLQGGQTSLAYLWKVKRLDGTILGFTTHDQNIVYDAGDGGDGLSPTKLSPASRLRLPREKRPGVDNIEFTGFLESKSIVEEDIRAGLFDGAAISVRIVNWADLTMGDVLIRSGTLGVVKMQNGKFTAEIRGLCYKLTTVLGALYGPVCRAMFGSGLNGIDLKSQ